MQCFLDFNDTKDGIPEIDTLLSGKEIAKRKYKLPIYVKENENYERRYAHLSQKDENYYMKLKIQQEYLKDQKKR